MFDLKLNNQYKYKTRRLTMASTYSPLGIELMATGENAGTWGTKTNTNLQIIEQILPYFQPDYTVTINAIPTMGIKRDVPITLNSVDYQDTYDGSFTNRRAVNYTLNFTAKTYLYGPVYAAKVIKETTADIFTDTASGSTREERIVVVPNPTTSDADDDFGFTTTIQNFSDGKKYSTTTDSDE